MAKDISSDKPVQVPKWDVALEALTKEEQQKLGRPLNLDDFRRLSRQYNIRLDDIMVTMFELCIHNQWRYQGGETGMQSITRELLNEMTAGGRLEDADLKNFSGGWVPVI
jgi:hypothetical protein